MAALLSPKKWLRRLAGVMLLVLMLGLAIAVLAPIALPPVLEKQLVRQLAQAGFPQATIAFHQLSWTHARMAIVLDPEHGPVLPQVEFDYSPFSLKNLHVENVAVQGLTMTLSVDAKGHVFLPGRVMAEQGPPAPLVIPVLPFKTLRLDQAVVNIQTESGLVKMTADLSARQTAPLVWEVAGQSRLSHGQGQVALEISGQVQAGGTVMLNAKITEGRVAVPKVQAEGIAGQVALTFHPQTRQLQVQAALDVEKITPTALPVIAQNVHIKTQYDPQQPTPLTADITVAKIENTSVPAYVAPARLQAQISGDLAGIIAVKSRIDVALDSLVIQTEAQHDMVSGKGQGTVALEPVTLGEFASLPDLLPWLAKHVDKLTGAFDGRAQLTWDAAKGLRAKGQFTLDKVTAQKDTTTVEGLSAALDFPSLMPLTTGKKQTVTADRIQAGITLDKPRVVFQLLPDKTVRLDDIGAQWSGGTVSVNPFSTPLAPPRFTTSVSLKNVQLDQLLKLAGVDGLAATGAVSGQVPVRLDGDTIRLEGGSLKAVGPGTLTYNPVDPPAFLQGDSAGGANILMQALTNFRYEDLGATLDGTVGQELIVGLKVKGSNPSFYNGYPVALNLGLSGALDTIVRRSLETYQIPQALQEQLLQQQEQGKE